MQTPWGESDYIEELARGIFHVTTPSHGGFFLSPSRVAEMPDCFKGATFGDNGPSWYEEDCDAAMVMLVFGMVVEKFGDRREAVLDALRYSHTLALQQYLSKG